MQPHEQIKKRSAPNQFAPKSSLFTPARANEVPARLAPGGLQTQARILSPPAAGAAGKAVTLKKLQGGKWGRVVADPAPMPPKGAPSPKVRPVLLPEHGARIKTTSPRSGQGYSSPRSPTRRAEAPLSYTMSGPASPHALQMEPFPGSRSPFKSPTKRPPGSTVVSPCAPEAAVRREHEDGCSVQDLTPPFRAERVLKKIHLDDSMPNFDDSRASTPQFRISAGLEVRQGVGPQAIHGFATNLDAEEPGMDQALCYNVWAHGAEVFAEGGLPVIDCEGTLFFTPSYHVGGVTMVTITLSDNAAILDGEVRTSDPVVMKLSVIPGALVVKKSKDWRSQTNRQIMAVAVLPDEESCDAPSMEEHRIFPPWNIHKLRERAKVKGHQDKAVRMLLPDIPVRFIHSHRRCFFGQQYLHTTTPTAYVVPSEEAEADLTQQLERATDAARAPLLRSLATLHYAQGAKGYEKCKAALTQLVTQAASAAGLQDVHVAEDNIPALREKVSRSASITGETDELTLQQDSYAMALLDLADFLTYNGGYQEAEPLIRKAIAVFEACHGTDHKNTLVGMERLVAVLSCLHRYDDACEASEKMRTAAELVHPHCGAELAILQHLSASCVLRCTSRLDQHTEALAMHKAAHAAISQCTRVPDARLLESFMYVAHALCTLGKFDEAAGTRKEAVELLTATPQLPTHMLVFLPLLHSLAARAMLLKGRHKSSLDKQDGAEDTLPAAAQYSPDALACVEEAVVAYRQLFQQNEKSAETQLVRTVLAGDHAMAEGLFFAVNMCALTGGAKGIGGALSSASATEESANTAVACQILSTYVSELEQLAQHHVLATCGSVPAGSPCAETTAAPDDGHAAQAGVRLFTRYYGSGVGVDAPNLYTVLTSALPDVPTLLRLLGATAAALVNKALWLGVKDSRLRRGVVLEAKRLIDMVVAANDTRCPIDPFAAACLEVKAELEDEELRYKDALLALEKARLCLEAGRAEAMGQPGHSGALARIDDMRVEMLQKGMLAPPSAYLADYTQKMAVAQQAYGEWDKHNVYPILNLAEVCYLEGHFEHAHRHFAKALAIVDSQNMHFLLGNLFKPATQLRPMEVHERNRLASERMTPQQCVQLGMILSQVAAVYERQGVYKEAESAYMQTLASFEIAGLPSNIGVSYALDGLARLLYFQGLHGDALSYFEKSADVRFRHHKHLKEEQQIARKNIQIVDATVCPLFCCLNEKSSIVQE